MDMDISQRRMFGSLLLLIGISAITVALYNHQFDRVVDMLKSVFQAI